MSASLECSLPGDRLHWGSNGAPQLSASLASFSTCSRVPRISEWDNHGMGELRRCGNSFVETVSPRSAAVGRKHCVSFPFQIKRLRSL